MAYVRDILDAKGRGVLSLGPDAMVLEALELMADQNVGAVVVMDGDRLVGIFTERLYAREVFLKGRGSPDTPLGAVMSREVLTVSPERTAEECIALMSDKRVRHLPVIEDGRLAGIISIGDLMKSVIDDREFDLAQLVDYVRG